MDVEWLWRRSSMMRRVHAFVETSFAYSGSKVRTVQDLNCLTVALEREVAFAVIWLEVCSKMPVRQPICQSEV